jgi:hypothetical protein
MVVGAGRKVWGVEILLAFVRGKRPRSIYLCDRALVLESDNLPEVVLQSRPSTDMRVGHSKLGGFVAASFGFGIAAG